MIGKQRLPPSADLVSVLSQQQGKLWQKYVRTENTLREWKEVTVFHSKVGMQVAKAVMGQPGDKKKCWQTTQSTTWLLMCGDTSEEEMGTKGEQAWPEVDLQSGEPIESGRVRKKRSKHVGWSMAKRKITSCLGGTERQGWDQSLGVGIQEARESVSRLQVVPFTLAPLLDPSYLPPSTTEHKISALRGSQQRVSSACGRRLKCRGLQRSVQLSLLTHTIFTHYTPTHTSALFSISHLLRIFIA